MAGIPDQGTNPEPVEERHRQVGDLVGVHLAELAALHPTPDHPGDPLPVALVHPARDRAQSGSRVARSQSSTQRTHSRSPSPGVGRHSSIAIARPSVAEPPPRGRPRSARPPRARTTGAAPVRAAPRGSRSSGGRALSRRGPGSPPWRSSLRRSRPRQSARWRLGGSAPGRRAHPTAGGSRPPWIQTRARLRRRGPRPPDRFRLPRPRPRGRPRRRSACMRPTTLPAGWVAAPHMSRPVSRVRALRSALPTSGRESPRPGRCCRRSDRSAPRCREDRVDLDVVDQAVEAARGAKRLSHQVDELLGDVARGVSPSRPSLIS